MLEQMSRQEKIRFCGLNLEAYEDFDNTISNKASKLKLFGDIIYTIEDIRKDSGGSKVYQIGNMYSNGDCIKDLNLAAVNIESIYKLGLPDFDGIYKKNIDETVDKVISNSISLGRIHISNNYTKIIAFSKELEKYDVFNRTLINRLDAVRTNSAINGLIINDYMAEKVKERKISGAEKIKIIYI